MSERCCAREMKAARASAVVKGPVIVSGGSAAHSKSGAGYRDNNDNTNTFSCNVTV